MRPITALPVVTEAGHDLDLESQGSGHNGIQPGIIDANAAFGIKRHLRGLLMPNAFLLIVFHFVVIV
ncbi:hypothetical protein D3C73_1597950 [compost metagenome]